MYPKKLLLIYVGWVYNSDKSHVLFSLQGGKIGILERLIKFVHMLNIFIGSLLLLMLPPFMSLLLKSQKQNTVI